MSRDATPSQLPLQGINQFIALPNVDAQTVMTGRGRIHGERQCLPGHRLRCQLRNACRLLPVEVGKRPIQRERLLLIGKIAHEQVEDGRGIVEEDVAGHALAEGDLNGLRLIVSPLRVAQKLGLLNGAVGFEAFGNRETAVGGDGVSFGIGRVSRSVLGQAELMRCEADLVLLHVDHAGIEGQRISRPVVAPDDGAVVTGDK